MNHISWSLVSVVRSKKSGGGESCAEDGTDVYGTTVPKRKEADTGISTPSSPMVNISTDRLISQGRVLVAARCKSTVRSVQNRKRKPREEVSPAREGWVSKRAMLSSLNASFHARVEHSRLHLSGALDLHKNSVVAWLGKTIRKADLGRLRSHRHSARHRRRTLQDSGLRQLQRCHRHRPCRVHVRKRAHV